MAEFALIDAFAYVAGHDFTTDNNQQLLNADATVLDATTFGSDGWRENAYGLKSLAWGMQGFWQSAASDAVDPEAFADLGVIDRVHTIGDTENQGDVAFLFLAGKSQYQLLGQLNELAPFALSSVGTNGVGVIRGQLAKAKGAVSAIGATGGGVELGQVAAGQFLYATWHMFAVGTTITVQVESDDNANFTSATARGTIGPITTRGGTWMTRVAGPITDTHYRFNVTANTGSHIAAGAIGIGS